MSKALIIIPIYKDSLTEAEKSSLIRCCKILGKYDFSLVCSNSLKTEAYEKVLREFSVNFKIERFDEKYFKSIQKYNLLMLDVDFYHRFAAYDYMLIYQLDAYVFRDDLIHWCEQGYDYIGAPWMKFDFLRNKMHILEAGLNGGFSLKKISSFIDVLENKSGKKEVLAKFIKGGRNEDGFFSSHAMEIKPSFKVAPYNIAMKFSFERRPEKLYKMTHGKLPFGCHAWHKYNPAFWKQFIHI